MCSYCLRVRSETGPLVASPLAAICRACADRAQELFASAPPSETGPETLPTPWHKLTDEALLERLPEAAAAGVQVESHLAMWVGAARERGISWNRIGDALGMTRQSAWERFKRQGASR